MALGNSNNDSEVMDESVETFGPVPTSIHTPVLDEPSEQVPVAVEAEDALNEDIEVLRSALLNEQVC